MKSVMQRLYDSEINSSVETFWDSGFEWFLGDGLNGILIQGGANTFAEAEDALAEAALEHFPDSNFARTYRGEAL